MTNLTAADLDALACYWLDLHDYAKRPASGLSPSITGRAIEDIDSLIAALRAAWAERDAARQERDEARGLVEALAMDDPIYYGGRDGDEPTCFWCEEDFSYYSEKSHAPDCAWDAARKARDAWGGKNE